MNHECHTRCEGSNCAGMQPSLITKKANSFYK